MAYFLNEMSVRDLKETHKKYKTVIIPVGVVEQIFQRPEIEVGVMGFPERATKEFGEILGKEVAEGMIEYVNMLNEKNS